MGALYAFVGALLFGANGSLVKVVLESGISPLQVTMFRTLGTAVLAGLVLVVTDRAVLRLRWRRVLALAVLGVVGVAMLQATFALALERLPVGVTLLFEFLAVLIVPLFALIVYRERIRPQLWGAIVCILGGLALVAQVWDSSLDPVGVLFALGAAAALAFYFIYGERQIAAVGPLGALFWSSLFAGLFWAGFSGWQDIEPGLLVESASLGGALAGANLPVWVLIVMTVAFGTFLPFLLSFLAIRRLRPTRAGILATSEVVFAFAVAWVWLGEALDLVQILGASIVLAGIVLAQVARPGTIADPNLAVATGAVEIVTGSIRVVPEEEPTPPRRDSNSRHDG